MRGAEEITQQDIIYIEKYANEGKSDEWIRQKLNIKVHIVAKTTREFWEHKMNKKPK